MSMAVIVYYPDGKAVTVEKGVRAQWDSANGGGVAFVVLNVYGPDSREIIAQFQRDKVAGYEVLKG
jgi:hypothetical protein